MAKELSQETLDLAEQIKAGIEIDSATGTATKVDNVYEASLPEGVTIDQVNAIGKHRTRFTAASAKAVGELAQAAMVANNKLESVEVAIPMGKYDTLNLKSSREKEIRNVATGETSVSYGHLSTPVIKSRSVNNSGELAMIRKALSEAGAASLKK